MLLLNSFTMRWTVLSAPQPAPIGMTLPKSALSERTPPMKTRTTPQTPDERVRASEARKIGSGGRRVPGGVLDPRTARALEDLQEAQYGPSATACISRALIEAAERLKSG